jgi:hypothetical protein
LYSARRCTSWPTGHQRIDFFAKLKEKEAETTFGAVLDTLSILSTHPANSERMESLQKAIDGKDEQFYKPATYDLKALQALLYVTANED